LGHSRQFGGVRDTSAFPLKTDLSSHEREVRLVPSTEIGACDIEVRFTLELGHRAMLSSQHPFGCAK
jgi:hypothetical protein